MSPEAMNKTMARSDLATRQGLLAAERLNALLRDLRAKGLAPSSWLGTLPGDPAEEALGQGGLTQRLGYEPLPGAEDDLRIPWFLYWEAAWVLRHAEPLLHPGARVLDGGGAASLFACQLASLGCQVHAVDINPRLAEHGNAIARAMGWDLHCHAMNLAELDFPDNSFEHAFSICVFEHLDHDLKQAALAEIARCLAPGGTLSLTFDYRNPAPGVVGVGKDPRPRNRISSPEDVRRAFLSTGRFEVLGNPEFLDNGESYLVHPAFGNTPYTFGSLFLRRLP